MEARRGRTLSAIAYKQLFTGKIALKAQQEQGIF